MSRTKIAPTLVYAHKPTPVRDVMQGKGDGIRAYSAAKAWEELRALLDAYDALDALTRPPAPCPPICPEWTRAFRARDRVRSLSSPPSRPRKAKR